MAVETDQMLVPLREIPCHRAISLPNAFVRSTISALPIRAALERSADDPNAGQAEANVELYAESSNVFARGTITGWLEVACSRCIGTVRVPVAETLNITFLPRSQVPVEDAQELEDVRDTEEPASFADALEDLDVYPYDGEQLDLTALLRDQLVLAVPYAPLCQDDCRGLCNQCGTDLNQTTCNCEPGVDPRLASLRTLKI